MKKNVLALAMLAALSHAHAQSPAPANTVSGYIGLGASTGGDKLASARYVNGGSVSIKAGGGVAFTGGVNVRISEKFSAQASVNFHVDDQTAENGSLKFQRFPLEALAFHHFDQHWKLGAGVRYVTGAKLSGSGVAEFNDVKFDNAVSPVIEVEYMFSPQAGVKLRYVNEKFEVKNRAGYGDVKANHIAISGNYYF